VADYFGVGSCRDGAADAVCGLIGHNPECHWERGLTIIRIRGMYSWYAFVVNVSECLDFDKRCGGRRKG